MTNDPGRRVREQLDDELAHLAVDEQARRRFHAAVRSGARPQGRGTARARSALRRPGTRWPVVAVAAAVTAVALVPGVAARTLRSAPAPSTVYAPGAGGVEPSPTSPSPRPSPSTVPARSATSTVKRSPSDLPAPGPQATASPATATVPVQLLLIFDASTVKRGTPVSVQVVLKADLPSVQLLKAGAAAGSSVVVVSWGDGQVARQTVTCPGSDQRKPSALEHTYRAPGRFQVKADLISSTCAPSSADQVVAVM